MKTFKGLILIFSNILYLTGAVTANENTGEWGMGHMMSWPWAGGMIFMMIPMFILVIGAIFLMIYVLRKAADLGGPSDFRQETPLEILKRRYARGEISREEFEEMKKTIS